MIDHDLSDQLHSLAATVDEPFDLHALHRRISMLSRRRSAVKVGVAGASVAAVVGGLMVVRDRPAPVGSETAAVGSAAPEIDSSALPDCAAVLAQVQAATSSTAPEIVKAASLGAAAIARSSQDTGFKGIVTILTVDGPRVTFSSDEPKIAPPTDGVAMVDATTEWVDGTTPLDTPPTLDVGEHVGLATTPVPDEADRVIFVDINATASGDDKPIPDDKATDAAPSAVTIVVDSGVLPAGPTAKSPGTITAVGATSIDVALDDPAVEPGATVVIDLAATPFYAGDTICVPDALTVGASVGVAYHTDDQGTLIGDAVLLIPQA